MGRRVGTVAGSMPTGKPVRLRRDPPFQPCATEPGDELYPNGIFEFNISRLIAFISARPERFPTETVELSEIPDYGSSKRLDDAAIQATDLSRPVMRRPSSSIPGCTAISNFGRQESSSNMKSTLRLTGGRTRRCLPWWLRSMDTALPSPIASPITSGHLF